MYSKSLLNKRCIYKNEGGGYEVNVMFTPDVTGDIIEYTFTLDMGD